MTTEMRCEPTGHPALPPDAAVPSTTVPTPC